jgi:type I restriction enzyme, S subunit
MEGLLLDDVKEMNFTASEAKIYELQPGDILLNEASGTPSEVGKPAIWNGEIEGCCFQNTLIRVRPIDVNARFLLHYLRADAMCGKFTAHTRGVNIWHLGAATAASWQVWVPSPEQQSAIVAEVEAAESSVEGTSTAVTTATERELLLRRSLLIEAFAGRLVSQDSNDEPASVLLERIRAEQGALRMLKRTRRIRRPNITQEALL